MKETLKPIIKSRAHTIGVFTPSMPAHILLADRYKFGIQNLQAAGFRVKEGHLTASLHSEGYRTAGGPERADEIMRLIRDPDVDILMANIGGTNSASILPYLNYDEIRDSRKLIVGYSDVTSLHMAILTKAGLRTCYGPAVTPSFGEWPRPNETAAYFSSLLQGKGLGPLPVPAQWSNTFRDYKDGSWKTKHRTYHPNDGWHALKAGKATGNIIIANLATLLCGAGTPYFPDLEDKILAIEEMEVTPAMFERRMNQLKLMGVLDRVKGLIFSKIEFQDPQACYRDYENILDELCANYAFPIMTNFDCGHTTPMLSLCQDTRIELVVSNNSTVNLLEAPVLRHSEL